MSFLSVLRFRGSAATALFLAVLVLSAGVALLSAERADDVPTMELAIDNPLGARTDAALHSDEVGRPGPRSLPKVETADHRPKTATARGGQPSAEEMRPASGVESSQVDACDPLIEDARGDIDNHAIDILESSMSYDATANTLSIRHVIDDIPATAPFPNEALTYDFDFGLDSMTYHVMAYIGAASSGQWYFAVQRDDRTSDQWPEGMRALMYPSGRVDHETDTVAIEIDVDEFNRGERRVAHDEGLPPAAGELRRGSELTSIVMTAAGRTAGPGIQDEAHGCDFVLEEQR